jgi:hypothetical protein
MGAAVNPTKDTILTREEAAAGMTPSMKRKEIRDKAAAAAAAKARADELKNIKALAAAKKITDKKAAADALKLAKAASQFDLEKIGIAAALKGKINEEEKIRLLLLQAIADEDVKKAEELSKKLEEVQKKNTEIAADLAIIAATKDPFATWANSLSLALIELAKYGKGLADVPNLVPGVDFNPKQNADRNYDLKVAAVTAAIEALATPTVIPPINTMPITMPTTNMPTPAYGNFGFSLPSYITSGANFAGGVNSPPAPIEITIMGNVMDGDDFTEKVNQAMINAQRKGYSQFPAGALP